MQPLNPIVQFTGNIFDISLHTQWNCLVSPCLSTRLHLFVVLISCTGSFVSSSLKMSKPASVDEYTVRCSENTPCKHTRSKNKLGSLEQVIKKQKHNPHQKVRQISKLVTVLWLSSIYSRCNQRQQRRSTGTQHSLGIFPARSTVWRVKDL
ncbi:hypothetical protein TNCV_1073771 [Trichonephila clavipes]|uniref:Uncharacterized protein n=1 Tax=Trichonephila clavipes TaxID=2585209 RepID=A0A8X6SPM9_TRICX|nr:hypothetical protein TNCV_1073771 [Trichonephila clavipes]